MRGMDGFFVVSWQTGGGEVHGAGVFAKLRNGGMVLFVVDFELPNWGYGGMKQLGAVLGGQNESGISLEEGGKQEGIG